MQVGALTAGRGFGYSGLQDVFMVVVHESCEPSDMQQTGHLFKSAGQKLDADARSKLTTPSF